MLPETSVLYHFENPVLSRVLAEAERGCRNNLCMFGDRQVLVEGGGYRKIWLETQPMGGEMYALRNMEAAINNQRFFMDTQREDGRIAGSIECTEDGIIPQFNKLQGFCFPFHALNMYYLIGEDTEYLDKLRICLEKFDAWLWKTRKDPKTGALCSCCVYDTGEDHAARYLDAPNYWEADALPEGFRSVPMASMDITSFSYACRSTLSEIARIRGDRAEGAWRKKAEEVAELIRRVFWDNDRGACFDIYADGTRADVLCHNTLRCMYWGSLSPDMAARFTLDHLLNPEEFMTPMPLPSVAVNDPAFRNAPENNWSGQSEGLTWQRAIHALENYGFYPLVTRLGKRLFRAIDEAGDHFVQQYDPFTGAPSLVDNETHQPIPEGAAGTPQEDYGPTMLAVLEYAAHMYGIHPHLGKVWFSLCGGEKYTWESRFYGHLYTIESDGKQARIFIDGEEKQVVSCGRRIITDTDGNIGCSVPIEQAEMREEAE